MSTTTTSATEREIQSIPLRGHTAHVWRTDTGHGWRVVRDSDSRMIADGIAGPEPEAWEHAVRTIPQFDHWDLPIPSICFDDYPGAPQMLLHRMEGITRAAYGVAAIGDVLFRHNLESDSPDAPDARPLRMRTVEGLTRALGVLAEYVEDAAHQAARDASSKR